MNSLTTDAVSIGSSAPRHCARPGFAIEQRDRHPRTALGFRKRGGSTIRSVSAWICAASDTGGAASTAARNR